MKKFFYLVICLMVFGVVVKTNAEDLHDIKVLQQHFDSAQDFEQWYNSLSQKNKNQVLTGTVYACRPDLTKAALESGGDIATKLMVIDITSGHDDDYAAYLYAYDTGDEAEFMQKVFADGMKRSEKAVKEESCGHTFSMMGSGTRGLLPLVSVGIKFCKNEDKKMAMVQLLTAGGANINEVNDLHVSPLSEAIEQKNIEVVKLLLQNGADFNQTYALSRMIDEYYSYDVDAEKEAIWDYVIAYLQEHKLTPEAETDAYIRTQFIFDKEYKAKAEKLNLSPDYTTMAAKEGILAAAERHNYDLLRELIDNGVNVNYRDKYGRTALFFAAKGDSPRDEDIAAVKYLLQHGADANIKDKSGKTAFDGCAYKICLLNPKGARKIDPDDKTVVPTLDQALDDNDCATIVEFIKNGVDPFIDIYGTPLFFRLYHHLHRKCLPDVLELGIDLNKVRIHRDYKGEIVGDVDTALTYANRYFWSKEVIPQLKEYGAVETDDTPRVATYNEMWKKYGYSYSEQAEAEIKQKLQEKGLKDWEVEVYQNLLKKQKYLKQVHDSGYDLRTRMRKIK